jgi:predicted acetyltransferase
MNEWLLEVRKKGYTISPYSDEKDLAAESLRFILEQEEAIAYQEMLSQD